MTDLAGALADTSGLTEFEGTDVIAAGIEISNSAGGLNDAMKVAPVEYHKGQKLRVLLDVEVTKIRFESIKDSDCLRRVHVASATAAMVVADDFGQKEMAANADRIQKMKEDAAGIVRLPMGEAMEEAHDAGDHAEERADGCPRCQDEIDAEEREAAEDAAKGE